MKKINIFNLVLMLFIVIPFSFAVFDEDTYIIKRNNYNITSNYTNNITNNYYTNLTNNITQYINTTNNITTINNITNNITTSFNYFNYFNQYLNTTNNVQFEYVSIANNELNARLNIKKSEFWYNQTNTTWMVNNVSQFGNWGADDWRYVNDGKKIGSQFYVDNTLPNDWIMLDTNSSKAFGTLYVSSTGAIKGEWMIQGSNDLSTWTNATLSNFTKTCSKDVQWTYPFTWSNIGSYRYWRLLKTSNPAGGQYINELQFTEEYNTTNLLTALTSDDTGFGVDNQGAVKFIYQNNTLNTFGPDTLDSNTFKIGQDSLTTNTTFKMDREGRIMTGLNNVHSTPTLYTAWFTIASKGTSVLGQRANMTMYFPTSGGSTDYAQIGSGYSTNGYADSVIAFPTSDTSGMMRHDIVFATSNTTTASPPTIRLRISNKDLNITDSLLNIKSKYNVGTGNVTSNGSAQLTGIGTLFLTEVQAGDYLYIDLAGSYSYRMVTSVSSNTLLSMDNALTPLANKTFGINKAILAGYDKNGNIVNHIGANGNIGIGQYSRFSSIITGAKTSSTTEEIMRATNYDPLGGIGFMLLSNDSVGNIIYASMFLNGGTRGTIASPTTEGINQSKLLWLQAPDNFLISTYGVQKDIYFGVGNSYPAMTIEGATATKGFIGLGNVTTPKNQLDVEGAVAIGRNYSGTNTGPVDGLIVSGNTGLGISNPLTRLHIDGNIWADSNVNSESVFRVRNNNTGTNTFVSMKLENDLTGDGHLSMYLIGTNATVSTVMPKDTGIITTGDSVSGGLNLVVRGGSASDYRIFNKVGSTYYERFTIHNNGATDINGPTTINSSSLVVLGTEQVVNGNFSAGDVNWTHGPNWTIANNRANYTGANPANEPINGTFYTTNGLYYKVEIDIINTNGYIDINTQPAITELSGQRLFQNYNGVINREITSFKANRTGWTNISFTPTASTGFYSFSIRPISSISSSSFTILDNSSVASIEMRGGEAGKGNLLIGPLSGQRITGGAQNVLIGNNVGSQIMTGSENTCIGRNTCAEVISSSGSVSIGSLSGDAVTSGSSNALVGYAAGSSITSGSYNTCMGMQSCLGTTIGAYNTAIGMYSLQTMGGSSNTVVGAYASGAPASTGDQNTWLGAYSGRLNNGTGNVFLGYGAGSIYTGSNAFIVDNQLFGTSPYMYGDMTNHHLALGGINKTTNTLDVSGEMVVGTNYAGVNTAPVNGLLVQGKQGIQVTNPLSTLDINSSMRISYNSTNYVELVSGIGGGLEIRPKASNKYAYVDIIQNHPYYGFLIHNGTQFGGQGLNAYGNKNDFIISTASPTQDIVFNAENWQQRNETARIYGNGNMTIKNDLSVKNIFINNSICDNTGCYILTQLNTSSGTGSGDGTGGWTNTSTDTTTNLRTQIYSYPSTSSTSYGTQIKAEFGNSDVGTSSARSPILEVTGGISSSAVGIPQNFFGIRVQPQFNHQNSSLTLENLYGLWFSPTMSGNANITNYYAGYYAMGTPSLGTTISNGYGIWINQPTSYAKYKNSYGMYISNFSGANYSVYSAGGVVRSVGSIIGDGNITGNTFKTLASDNSSQMMCLNVTQDGVVSAYKC